VSVGAARDGQKSADDDRSAEPAMRARCARADPEAE
jgi:hypothetical protein